MGEPVEQGSLTGTRRFVEAVGGQLVLQVQYNDWTERGWRPMWRYATREDVPQDQVGDL